MPPTTCQCLAHWGRVMHICVSKLTIIVPDNGLAPDRPQAIIWINAGILLIQTLGTKFSEIFSEIHKFSFKKMHLKMSSAKWRPFCLGLNVLFAFVLTVLSHHFSNSRFQACPHGIWSQPLCDLCFTDFYPSESLPSQYSGNISGHPGGK